jgi:DNA-binding XRE family transcriptional regulator
MRYENDMINLNNVVHQKQTLLGISSTNFSKPKGIRDCALNPSDASNSRKQIIELRSINISMTMSEIANIVGISRQRVFQILREEGLPTKHYNSLKKYNYQCPVCGTISPHKFCSNECKKKWQQVPVICSRCGKLFFRDLTQFLHNYRDHSQSLFCSKDCAAKWLGEMYGYKSCFNRNGSSGCASKCKWDYDLVWETHINSGNGASQLSRRLRVPRSTIYAILSRCRKKIGDSL